MESKKWRGARRNENVTEQSSALYNIK